ncbi:hypothetical protein Leryth_026130 [Lithospermum erythrorhizon]|nr:hypothetical protein Leryth_026130 [Lithospermum erythrorhizon]
MLNRQWRLLNSLFCTSMMAEDHVQSLKKGLEFLGKLYTFSTNRNLARSSRQLATKVKRHSLSVYGDENEDLRRIMMNLVNIIKKIGESSYIFNTRDLSHNYRSIIDLLLEYISDVKNTWYNNRNASSDDQTAALEKKAEPIVSSCYMEKVELEEVMSGKLNDILISVIGQIKMIKHHHGSQEIKPYGYPKVDFYAFLEYFLRYLKELRAHEQISIMWSEIDSLHTDFRCLMSSPNTSQEKLSSGRRCTDILRLAYQAEYVMDMYLVIPDSSCISTLSNIVAEVKEIKEKLLALPDRSLPVEDVVVYSVFMFTACHNN